MTTSIAPPSDADVAATLTESPLQHALQKWAPNSGKDRRQSDRCAIPLLMRLSPLDGRDGPVIGPAITVVGKDLSERGVAIYHESRLPHRYCELTFEEGPFGPLTLRVELSWCRFTRLGWYESGGRVLSSSESDAA